MNVFSLNENEAIIVGDEIVVRDLAVQNDAAQIKKNGHRTGARKDRQDTGDLSFSEAKPAMNGVVSAVAA